MTTATMEKPAKVAKNGVDVPALLGTIGVVGENPELAKFQFRANGEWQRGTHSSTTVNGYFGAGEEHGREADFVIEADHPVVFCGGDNGANPMEYLLTALAACITAGIGNIASVRQIELKSVQVRVEGDVDMRGLLGLDDSVRNGFQSIRANVAIDGDAAPEALAKVVEQAVARSAAYDMLKNGTSVDVSLA
ncbi:MAG: OsmC family protein [Paracoccaceae bacterium]|nr:OsmC family protein [Paracoccaceae bacterium]